MRMPKGLVAVLVVLHVSKLAKERAKLVVAPMDIADDVERPVVVTTVGIERLALNRRFLDHLHRVEREDVPESLALQAAQRSAQQPCLVPNDLGTELPIGPALVALDADVV